MVGRAGGKRGFLLYFYAPHLTDSGVDVVVVCVEQKKVERGYCRPWPWKCTYTHMRKQTRRSVVHRGTSHLAACKALQGNRHEGRSRDEDILRSTLEVHYSQGVVFW